MVFLRAETSDEPFGDDGTSRASSEWTPSRSTSASDASSPAEPREPTEEGRSTSSPEHARLCSPCSLAPAPRSADVLLPVRARPPPRALLPLHSRTRLVALAAIGADRSGAPSPAASASVYEPICGIVAVTRSFFAYA